MTLLLVFAVAPGTGLATTPDVTDKKDDKIKTDTGSILTTDEVSTAEVEGDVALAGTSEFAGISPGETITIWTGVVDDGAPVSSADVTVEIRNSSRDVIHSFETTTDDRGSVAVDYEIPELASGEYRVRANTEDGSFLGSEEFIVGSPLTVSTSESFSAATFVDTEATLSVRATDQDGPVSGESADISVRNPAGDTVETASITTDTDGFDQITFTPEMVGAYEFEAVGDDDNLAGVNDEVIVAEYIVEFDESVDSTRSMDGSVPIAGHAYTVDGPATGETISVAVLNESDEIVTTLTGTVDKSGAFLVEWDEPDSPGRYELETEIDDKTIPTEIFGARLRIEERSDDESDPEPEVDINLKDRYDSQFSPGDTVKFDIEAADKDDNPIAGESVSVRFGYGWDAEIAIKNLELTTNESGQASGAFDIPANSATGTGVLRGKAAIELENTTLTDDTSSADVQEYFVSLEASDAVEPGTETAFELSATDADGNPVEGVSYGVDFQYNYRQESIATASATTGPDGTGSMSVTVPSDVQQLWAGGSGFYELDDFRSWSYSIGGAQGYQRIDVDHPDAGLTVDKTTVAPGGTVTAEYDADVGAAVIGATGYNYDADFQIAEPGEEVTFDVPAGTEAFSIDVAVTGLNADRSRVTGTERVRISDDAAPEPTLETDFEYEPATPTVDDTVSFTASVIEADNPVETYSWAFGDGTSEALTKEATHTFETEGSYEVTLTVTDSDGNTDSTTKTVSVAPETDEGGDGGTIEAPTGVEIPETYAEPDGSVGPGGLGDAATDFRAGDIGPGTLGDVAGAFRAS